MSSTIYTELASHTVIAHLKLGNITVESECRRRTHIVPLAVSLTRIWQNGPQVVHFEVRIICVVVVGDVWPSENGRPPSSTVVFRLRMAVLRPVPVPFHYCFLDYFSRVYDSILDKKSSRFQLYYI
jgi:hypothetical protein